MTFSWRLNEIPPAAKMVLVESVQTFGWMIQTLNDTEDTVRESAVRKHERQELGLASRHWVRRQWRMILSKMKQQKFINAKILNHLSIGPKQNYGKETLQRGASVQWPASLAADYLALQSLVWRFLVSSLTLFRICVGTQAQTKIQDP